MFHSVLSGLPVKRSDKFCVMQHLPLHAGMLASNRTVYNGSSGFNRDTAGGSGSYGTVDHGESRPVLANVFQHLLNERVVLEREADMHDIASRDRRRQIDVNTERLMLALNDLQQGFADLSEADDDDSLVHSRNRNR